MKPERRGMFLVVAVLLVSAVLGGIYGPNVRATSASTDFKSAFEEEMRDLERQAREVERRKAELLAQANSALQAQPATQGTPSGVETQAAPTELASGSSPSSETASAESGATEGTPPDGPVLAPVPESTFARGSHDDTPEAASEPPITEGSNAEPTESHELQAKVQRAATDD